MKSRFYGALLFLSLTVQAAWADCNTWLLDTHNVITGETKTYAYYFGEGRQVPMPALNKFKCSFEVQKEPETKDHPMSAALSCVSSKKGDGYTITTNALCFAGHQGQGGLSITDVDFKTGKLAGYIFQFRPR